MLDSQRMIVPARAVAIITKERHRAHSGVEKTYITATQLYNWPGMKNSIRQTINNCSVCREDQPKQARPTATITRPSTAKYPMNHVGTDLFDAIGKKWSVLADRYSGYAWASELKCTDMATVVDSSPIGSRKLAGQRASDPTEGHSSAQNSLCSAASPASNMSSPHLTTRSRTDRKKQLSKISSP